MGEDVQLPAPQPEEPSDSEEVTPVQPEVTPTQPGLAPEAVAPTPPAAEQQPDYNQLLANVETATDPADLMAALSALEKARPYDKAGVYSKGYEAAVRLKLEKPDLAIMYGNLLAAATLEQLTKNLHAAVGGLMEGASRISSATNQLDDIDKHLSKLAYDSPLNR